MRIAIIDSVNQDIGLKILFPEADYFINNDQDCTRNNRINSYNFYNISVSMDWSKINDENYDYLFIIIPIYDANPDKFFYKKNIHNIYQRILPIIKNNNFTKIFIFDNYDYDYDPSEYFMDDKLSYEKISFFFKRNYNNKKTYNANVVPFPFIMFGEKSLIEKCDTEILSKEEYTKHKINRVFFTGSLFEHQDNQYNVFRNRNILYNELKSVIYNPGWLNYNSFLYEMKNSKFSLDLLGVGEPNKRTIEILLSGSLMLCEKNDLKWPFEERFSEETFFSNSVDFFEKLNILNNDDELYKKCLENQYNIVNKYFNKKWLREYILNFLQNTIYTVEDSKCNA